MFFVDRIDSFWRLLERQWLYSTQSGKHRVINHSSLDLNAVASITQFISVTASEPAQLPPTDHYHKFHNLIILSLLLSLFTLILLILRFFNQMSLP